MSADMTMERVDSADTKLAEQFRYERLMSLSVRHDFYGRSGLCRDFVITPTAATQTLLRRLGLVARPRAGGFDVFYHGGRAAALVRHLCNRRDDHRQAGPPDLDRIKSSSWDRLTLTFTLDNHLFTNFTEMPFAVRPGRDCLYLSNRDARADGDTVSLTVRWNDAVKQPTFSSACQHLRLPANTKRAVFYHASGRAFLCADKPAATHSDKPEVPAKPAPGREQAAKPSRHPLTLPGIGMTPGSNLHLDMTREPAGRYSYAITTDEPGARPGAENAFLYTGTDHVPLLMVDLFFDGPDNSSGSDWLPVKLPETFPKETTQQAAMRDYIKPRNYEIHFEARKTIWTYYVVLPAGSTAFNSLSIEAASKDAPTFGRPARTILAGRPASIFTARSARKLQSRPDVALRLRGAGANGSGSARILLDRLPLPSAETIIPRPEPDKPAASEVFVYL
jgi:hypothetical protein